MIYTWLTLKLSLFSQIEFLNAFLPRSETFFCTQHFRACLKLKELQFGVGLDLSQSGRNDFTKAENAVFLLYEF